MNYLKASLAIATIALLAAGCSSQSATKSSTAEPPSNAPVSENSVEIKDYAFTPQMLTVKKGTTVTWTNRDQARHNVVAQGSNADTGPKSDLLSTGQSYTYTFNEVGTYDYLCEPHPYMKARVVVTE